MDFINSRQMKPVVRLKPLADIVVRISEQPAESSVSRSQSSEGTGGRDAGGGLEWRRTGLRLLQSAQHHDRVRDPREGEKRLACQLDCLQ